MPELTRWFPTGFFIGDARDVWQQPLRPSLTQRLPDLGLVVGFPPYSYADIGSTDHGVHALP